MQVTVDLSSPEQHPTSAMPKAMRQLWYRNDGLLKLIEAYGCPNSGCEHTLRFTADRADVIAWLDLFVETYPETYPDIHMVKERIRLAFVQGNGCRPDGSFMIKLKDITRQVGYNGEIITRRWFWAPFWEETNA